MALLPNGPGPSITIHFDNDNKIQLNKSYLIHHSLYFKAMFSGQFMEAQSGNQITLKNINDKGFFKVINCIKFNFIDFGCLEELFLLLETSLILQFTEVIKDCLKIVEERYLFTIDSTIQIFSFASMLGLQELSDKARIYILLYFKSILIQFREGFLELSKEELQLLLNDNSLNVDDETDVYNLIIDWCRETNNDIEVEYDIAIGCVRFNCMTKTQLESCILKTNNIILQNAIKQFYHKDTVDFKSILIRPPRNIPCDLCAIKNENDGYAYIYRWNWTTMNFEMFIKVDPLPRDSTGYHVVIKNLDIYIIGGEIGFGRGLWNDSGWKYNLLSKKWTKLDNFSTSKRRHGIGRFCGDSLYLIGGRTKHRLENTLVEKFKLDKDMLVSVNSCQIILCNNFTQKVDRKDYISLEYNSQFVLINKELEPKWFTLRYINHLPNMYVWDVYRMNLEAKIICAVTFRENVYVLAYNEQNTIGLYIYFPVKLSCEELKSFKTVYNMDSTMCTFNVDKAIVFGNKTIECYSISDNIYNEYTIQMDNVTHKYFFSIPVC